MTKDSNDFKVKLIFNRLKTNDYKSIILLCKALPNFKQAIGRREYNEIVLNKKEFSDYFHKFFFVCDQVNKYKTTNLFFNDEKTNVNDIKSLYYNLGKTLINNSEWKYGKRKNIIMSNVKDKPLAKTDLKSKVLESLEGKNKKNNKIKNQDTFLNEVQTLQNTFDDLVKEIENTNVSETATYDKRRLIPSVTFNDIGGIDDILGEIKETIELPLKAPQIFHHLNIRPHKGVLLYGPSGCGKTMIAKAIANEIKAHFIPIMASELMSMWHGLSEKNLREIFREAKENEPSIIYFDEIDSIAKVRSNDERGRYDYRFLNQLLTLMDGIEDYGNICVIGSTNMIESIDKALLRPGRFDLKILVKMPDKKGCNEIFNKAIKNMPINTNFDKDKFSNLLIGLSGAEISFVAREAAYNCMRRNLNIKQILSENKEVKDLTKLIIDEDDFYNALGKVKNQYK